MFENSVINATSRHKQLHTTDLRLLKLETLTWSENRVVTSHCLPTVLCGRRSRLLSARVRRTLLFALNESDMSMGPVVAERLE